MRSEHSSQQMGIMYSEETIGQDWRPRLYQYKRRWGIQLIRWMCRNNHGLERFVSPRHQSLGSSGPRWHVTRNHGLFKRVHHSQRGIHETPRRDLNVLGWDSTSEYNKNHTVESISEPVPRTCFVAIQGEMRKHGEHNMSGSRFRSLPIQIPIRGRRPHRARTAVNKS